MSDKWTLGEALYHASGAEKQWGAWAERSPIAKTIYAKKELTILRAFAAEVERRAKEAFKDPANYTLTMAEHRTAAMKQILKEYE